MSINPEDYIEHVAHRLLGEPNKALTTNSQLRFGTHGSIAVEIAGDKRGTWYDHEHQIGGGVIELINYKAGLSARTIERWVRMRLLPAPVRMGRTSLFHVPTVKRHLEHLSATTSDRCPRIQPKC